jgi:preprotein translocase subunit SecA
LQAAHAPAQTPPPPSLPRPAETSWQPPQPGAAQAGAAAIPTRAPSTTIDALEREFERKKQHELNAARQAGGSATVPQPQRSGPTPGRNEECFCGSGKKYKKCHGANA